MKIFKFFTLIFLFNLLLVFKASQGLALLATSTWDGSANTLWTTAANWDALPANNSALIFPPGAMRLSNNNDFSNGTAFAIIFTGSGYTLSGSSVVPIGLSADQPSGVNTVNLDLALNGVLDIEVTNSGADLNIGGNIDLNTFNLIISGAGETNISGDILGTAGLTKQDQGILTLSGSNAYTGATAVQGGVLILENGSGSATGSGALSLDTGTELQGDGQTDSSLTVNSGAQVTPGNSPGILAVGSTVFQGDALFQVEINGPVAGSEYSVLAVTGSVTLNNPILRIALGPAVTAGDDFVIINNDLGDDVSGQFFDLPEGETFTLVGLDDVGFRITYQGGDGNDIELFSIPTISIDDVTVEEPSAGTANATFTVSLSETSGDTISVDFATADGTATGGVDYEDQDGTLSFSPGQTTKTINVVINSDSTVEQNETFFIDLFNPTNASVAVDQATGTITPPFSPNGNGGCLLVHEAAESRGALVFILSLATILALRLHRRLSQNK